MNCAAEDVRLSVEALWNLCLFSAKCRRSIVEAGSRNVLIPANAQILDGAQALQGRLTRTHTHSLSLTLTLTHTPSHSHTHSHSWGGNSQQNRGLMVP